MYRNPIYCSKISPSGRYSLHIGENQVTVYDNEARRIISIPFKDVFDAIISPDEDLLVTLNSSEMRLYSLATHCSQRKEYKLGKLGSKFSNATFVNNRWLMMQSISNKKTPSHSIIIFDTVDGVCKAIYRSPGEIISLDYCQIRRRSLVLEKKGNSINLHEIDINDLEDISILPKYYNKALPNIEEPVGVRYYSQDQIVLVTTHQIILLELDAFVEIKHKKYETPNYMGLPQAFYTLGDHPFILLPLSFGIWVFSIEKMEVTHRLFGSMNSAQWITVSSRHDSIYLAFYPGLGYQLAGECLSVVTNAQPYTRQYSIKGLLNNAYGTILKDYPEEPFPTEKQLRIYGEQLSQL